MKVTCDDGYELSGGPRGYVWLYMPHHRQTGILKVFASKGEFLVRSSPMYNIHTCSMSVSVE